MKHNSRRAWKLLKNLSNDPTKSHTITSNVTANQIAHQLLLNGKVTTRQRKLKIERDEQTAVNMLKEPFNLGELELAIKDMKLNRAAGVDDLMTEQIKQFGPTALRWVNA